MEQKRENVFAGADQSEQGIIKTIEEEPAFLPRYTTEIPRRPLALR